MIQPAIADAHCAEGAANGFESLSSLLPGGRTLLRQLRREVPRHRQGRDSPAGTDAVRPSCAKFTDRRVPMCAPKTCVPCLREFHEEVDAADFDLGAARPWYGPGPRRDLTAPTRDRPREWRKCVLPGYDWRGERNVENRLRLLHLVCPWAGGRRETRRGRRRCRHGLFTGADKKQQRHSTNARSGRRPVSHSSHRVKVGRSR